MRGPRENAALGIHQTLDAFRRTVEARGQAPHFIVAFDVHAGGQVPFPELVDALLQALKAAGHVADDRVGTDDDGRGETAEDEQGSEWTMSRPLGVARGEPTTVGQSKHHRWPAASRDRPTRNLVVAARRKRRAA